MKKLLAIFLVVLFVSPVFAIDIELIKSNNSKIINNSIRQANLIRKYESGWTDDGVVELLPEQKVKYIQIFKALALENEILADEINAELGQ